VCGGSVVEYGKLEVVVEGSSNELELIAEDLGNNTMEGLVKRLEYVGEECRKCI
jgi:hypothetical protein